MGGLMIRLSGPFSVLDSAGRPIAVGSRKSRRLLARLAAWPGRRVGLVEIQADLWPQHAPRRPTDNIATMVSRLRSALGAEVVMRDVAGYRLGDPPAVRTDVQEAMALDAEAGRRLTTAEPGLAAAAARRGIDLLTDQDVLVGEAEADWIDRVRAEVAALRRELWCHLAEAALAIGDPRTAVAAAGAAAAADALDEHAHRLLMSAHHAAGEPSRAVAGYERLRAALVDELGIDPANETQALHVAVLRGDRPPVVSLPRAAGGWARVALAGRDDELARLCATWSAVNTGAPALVLLTGEAGIGKTTLAEAVAALAAETGGLVVSARCHNAERSMLLQPVLDAIGPVVAALPPGEARAVAGSGAGVLAGLLPEAAAVLGEPDTTRGSIDVERRRIHDAVGGLLRRLAGSRAVLLLLDDLHNAGLATVEFLHYLHARADHCRLLVLATVRSEDGAAAIDALADVGTRMEIGHLPPDAVALLAARAGVPRRAEEVLRRTRGHALFVVETLRGITARADGLPESIHAAVAARTTRTGPDVEIVLRAGAVLGAQLTPDIVAAVLDLPLVDVVRACAAAVTARLLVAAGPTYEFANELIQESIYTSTPTPVRLACHRRAADLLADQPEAIAAHAAALGDLPRAARAWLAAGELAAARYAVTDARALLDRALPAASGEPELLGRILLARAGSLEILGEFEAAEADLRAALRWALTAGDRHLELAVLRQHAGDIVSALGRPERERQVDAALRIAVDIGDLAAQADMLGWRAVVAANRLQFVEAVERGEHAVVAGRAADDDAALVAGLDGLKTAHAYLGATTALRPVLDELVPLLRQQGNLMLLRWAVFESALPAVAAAEWDAAAALLDEAEAINRRCGQLSHAPWFTAHRCWLDRLRGRFDDALESGERALSQCTDAAHPWWRVTAATQYATTLLETGAGTEAATLLRGVRAVAEQSGTEAYLLRCLAPLAEATGDGAVLDRADALLAGIRAPEGHAWLAGGDAYLAVARAWLGAGAPARARAVLGPLLRAADRHRWIPWQAAGALVDGHALAALGRHNEATQRVAVTAALAEQHGMPHLAAQRDEASVAAARAAPHGSTGR